MANDSSALTATSPKFKLSVMMFLEFFLCDSGYRLSENATHKCAGR